MADTMRGGKKANPNRLQPGKKKRSKLGCRNCKLRGVKCDEAKPECRRCLQYGVVCSYASKTTRDDLQFSIEQEITMAVDNQERPSLETLEVYQKPVYFEVPEYLSYWPTRTDELLNKFQLITAMTISVGPRTTLYQTKVVERARSYPFMLNALQALTEMHIRSLTAGMSTNPSPEEAEYCYLAVSLFAKEVVKPRDPEHQAMLLAAASMIYNMTFANLDAKTPEEAWPLAPPTPTDLGWLKVSAAKKQLSQLANPMGNDNLFAALSSSFAPEIAAMGLVVPPAQLPLGFISLFGLDSRSDCSDNPYFIPATKLARILDSTDTIFVTLGWIQVIGAITNDFKVLLYQKDARALLLLACWFAKISNMPVWWYRHRAIIEGQAICLYLERYHADNINLQVLLRFPKSIFQQTVDWDVYPRSQDEFDASAFWSRGTTPTASSASVATPSSTEWE